MRQQMQGNCMVENTESLEMCDSRFGLCKLKQTGWVVDISININTNPTNINMQHEHQHWIVSAQQLHIVDTNISLSTFHCTVAKENIEHSPPHIAATKKMLRTGTLLNKKMLRTVFNKK